MVSWFSVVVVGSVERFVESSWVVIVSVVKVVNLVKRFVTSLVERLVTLCSDRRVSRVFRGVIGCNTRFVRKGLCMSGPRSSFIQGYGFLYSLSDSLFVEVVVPVVIVVTLVGFVTVHGNGMVCNKWNVCCCSTCFDFVITVTWYYQMTCRLLCPSGHLIVVWHLVTIQSYILQVLA